MSSQSFMLNHEALLKYDVLCREAIDHTTEFLYAKYGYEYSGYGEAGHEACREDIEFNLKLLHTSLETGSIDSYVQYFMWLDEVFKVRNIPSAYVDDTLSSLGAFFINKLPKEGEIIQCVLENSIKQARTQSDILTVNDDALVEVPQFEEMLLNGDHLGALKIIKKLFDEGLTFIEVEVRLIEAALINVGLKWQQNKISVAQEHLATATASTVMAMEFSALQLPRANGKSIILACIEGNHHALGLKMIADAFELKGWNVNYLGADMPTRSLIDFVSKIKPDVVALSVSFSYQLVEARKVLNLIRSTASGESPHIIVGGLAVNRYPDLYEFIGADSTAKDALQVTSEMFK